MSANIPTPRTFVYKTDENGCEVACDVYVPGKISNPCPMIIWMHYSGLVFENRHAVGTHMFYSGPRRGFVIVNIDYRLAPQAKMEDIYQDVEDCARWCRQVLPTKLGNGIVDPEKLIIGGGSCGAQLALTTGLYLQPPPIAIVSLYPITDPTDDAFTTKTKPNPPPGRSTLIMYDEVREYIGPDAPMVSHPEISSNIPEFTYWGRASAYFYMLQEGIYLESVYGTSDKAAIDQRWNIAANLSKTFPPVFAAHAQQDRFVPHRESEKLVKALQEKGVEHEWWSVPGEHDHGFDALDIDAGEEGDFGKEFAAKLWPWLERICRDC